MKTVLTVCATALLLTSCAGLSPYSADTGRSIKALAPREIASLKAGEGMGLARAAELNQYPGPMHVLELASALSLSAEQKQRTTNLLTSHKAEARALGEELILAETELDSVFREKTASVDNVKRLTLKIGEIQAKLRASHLLTHLQQTALLNSIQISEYQKLRGY
jgi:hypothetical protein